MVKSRRIAPIVEYVTCTSPNEIELVAMANALSPSVKYSFQKMEQCQDEAEAVEYLLQMLSPAMFFLLEKGIKLLLVTLGSNGVFICCKEHINFIKDQRKCKLTPFSTQLLEKLDGCFWSNIPVHLCEESSSRTCVYHLSALSASVISLTGAGDCLVGGVLSALCGGLDIIQSVAVGVAVAKASVESEANIPDNISAATVAGVEIYCAPTADFMPSWQASMTHIALEGGCFVLSAIQFCHRKDYPPAPEYTFTGLDEEPSPESVISPGGSVIISPSGTVLAGPNYEGEALLTADLDLGEIVRAKFDFDVVGHYSRPEVLSLVVKTDPKTAVSFTSASEKTSADKSDDVSKTQ